MNSKKWIVIGSLTIMFLWIVYYFVIRSLDDPGTFGDMFGALNTLFTGLAFVGVVISLLQQNVSLVKQQKALEQQQTVLNQQQEALKIQKKELELYKSELQENTAQLREQSDHMRLQRIESTIFKLIEAHDNAVKDIASGPLAQHGIGVALLDTILRKNIHALKDFQLYDAVNFKESREYKTVVNDEPALTKFMYTLTYIDNIKDIDAYQKEEFMSLFNAQISLGVLSLYVMRLSSSEYHKSYLDLMKKYKMM